MQDRLLVIAMIVVPLVLFLIAFGEDAMEYFDTAVTGAGTDATALEGRGREGTGLSN